MKNNRFNIVSKLIVSVCAAFSCLYSFNLYAVGLGELAPDFSLPSNFTKNAVLSNFKGKVVYLDFWASWCGPCRQSFPWMNEMQSKYGSQGLEVLAINLDGNQVDAQNFLKENIANFKLAFDANAQTPKMFGVKGMPTSYLIDRHGKIVAVHLGFNPSKKASLEAEIRNTLEIK